jgi:hypothetical protein
MLLCTIVTSDHARIAEAHGNEIHGAPAFVTTTTNIAELEQMVQLLEQLVLLMNALQIQKSYAPITVIPHNDDAGMMTEHHALHASTTDVATPSAETPKPVALVIEVESHFNKTHVHVRYVDKPEDMFFTTVPITDVDGIVRETAMRTGLGADMVRAALTFE